jgi:hypothetical protein
MSMLEVEYNAFKITSTQNNSLQYRFPLSSSLHCRTLYNTMRHRHKHCLLTCACEATIPRKI